MRSVHMLRSLLARSTHHVALLTVLSVAMGCAGSDSRRAATGGGTELGSVRTLLSFAPSEPAALVQVKFGPLRQTPVYSAIIGILRDRGLGATFQKVERACGFFWPHTIEEAVLVRTPSGALAILELGIGNDEALACAEKALGAVPYMQDQSLKLVRAGEVFFASASGRMLIGDRLSVVEALRLPAPAAGAIVRDSVVPPLTFRGVLADEGGEFIEGSVFVRGKACEFDAALTLPSRAVASKLAKTFQRIQTQTAGRQELARRLIEALDVRAEGTRLRAHLSIDGDARSQAQRIDLLIGLAEAFQRALHDAARDDAAGDANTE
jgi:hypothetical protein